MNELQLPIVAAPGARGGPSSSFFRRSTCPPDEAQEQISVAQGSGSKTSRFHLSEIDLLLCRLGVRSRTL
jgi:hypothetical protein